MKKTILFIAFLLTATLGYTQVYDANNYGIVINNVNEAGEASITVPDGRVFVLKAIINPSGKNRGRLTGRGLIMDVPITAASMEWSASEGKKVPVGLRYNEAAGFTAWTATAYHVEGFKGSDGKMHFTVQQAVGSWVNVPNPASWVTWYADQTLPIKNYYRVVNIGKRMVSENQQAYDIAL
jgi:hypothetical protein